MKILKTGKWKKHLTCKGCSSQLEAEVEDVEVEQVQNDEEFVSQFFIKCPVCSTKNIQKNIPDKIAAEITDV